MESENIKFAVLNIKKFYTNGVKTVSKVLNLTYWGDNEEELFEEVAADWGMGESSGQNNGYRLEWKKETDVLKIKEALKNQVNENEMKILVLVKENDNLKESVRNL